MKPVLTGGAINISGGGIMITEGGRIIFYITIMSYVLSLLNDPSVNQGRSQTLYTFGA